MEKEKSNNGGKEKERATNTIKFESGSAVRKNNGNGNNAGGNIINFPQKENWKKWEGKKNLVSIKLIFPPGVKVLSIDKIMDELQENIKGAQALTSSVEGYSGNPETESQLFGITLRAQDLGDKKVQDYLNNLEKKGIIVKIRAMDLSKALPVISVE